MPGILISLWGLLAVGRFCLYYLGNQKSFRDHSDSPPSLPDLLLRAREYDESRNQAMIGPVLVTFAVKLWLCALAFVPFLVVYLDMTEVLIPAGITLICLFLLAGHGRFLGQNLKTIAAMTALWVFGLWIFGSNGSGAIFPAAWARVGQLDDEILQSLSVYCLVFLPVLLPILASLVNFWVRHGEKTALSALMILGMTFFSIFYSGHPGVSLSIFFAGMISASSLWFCILNRWHRRIRVYAV